MDVADFVKLCDQHDRAYEYWKHVKKDKLAMPWVVQDALERLNKLTDDMADAQVLAMTEPKRKRAIVEDKVTP